MSDDDLSTFYETGLFAYQGVIEVPAQLTQHSPMRLLLPLPCRGKYFSIDVDRRPETFSYLIAEHTALLLGVAVTRVDPDPHTPVPNYQELHHVTSAYGPDLENYLLDPWFPTSASSDENRKVAVRRVITESDDAYDSFTLDAAPPISDITLCRNCGQGAYVAHIAMPPNELHSNYVRRTAAELVYHVDPEFPDHPSICGIKAEAVVYNPTDESTKEDMVCKHCNEQVDLIMFGSEERESVHDFGGSIATYVTRTPRHITYHTKSGSPYCYGKLGPPRA